MRNMRKLVKTIEGRDCEVFAIHHHDRIPVGKADPTVAVYEDNTEVPALGRNSIRHKKAFFSIVICPDPEMETGMTEEMLRGLTAFDLQMWLPCRDDTYAAFMVYGVADVDLAPDRWEFRINDKETLAKLLAL